MHRRAVLALVVALGCPLASAQEYYAIERAEAVLEKSTDARARRAAVRDLAALHTPKAIPLLLSALRPRGRDPREDWFVRKSAASALIELGPPAAEALLPFVRDPSVEVRLSCIEVLTALRAPGVEELLSVRLAEEPEPTLRSSCIAALVILKADLAPIAKAAKEDADERVRARAAAALLQLKGGATGP